MGRWVYPIRPFFVSKPRLDEIDTFAFLRTCCILQIEIAFTNSGVFVVQRAYWMLTLGVVALGLAVALSFYPVPKERLTLEQVAEKHGLGLVRSGSEYYLCDQQREVSELRKLISNARNKDSWKGIVIINPAENQIRTSVDGPLLWDGTETTKKNSVLFGDPEIIKRILPDLD